MMRKQGGWEARTIEKQREKKGLYTLVSDESMKNIHPRLVSDCGQAIWRQSSLSDEEAKALFRSGASGGTEGS